MIFKIEFSDQQFRVVAPNGDYEEAVPYCMVSTVEYDGRVYGAYLTGSEPELDELSQHPTLTIARARDSKVKVHDLSAWPVMSAVETELEEIDFDDEEDDSAEGEIVDVEPAE